MRTRPAARVILRDDAGRVLLFRYVDPAIMTPGRPPSPAYWATPGGAVEAGEGVEAAARRELAEETGLLDVAIGPCVAVRTHVLSWHGEPVRCVEHYFPAQVAAGRVIRTDGLAGDERLAFRAHRWWPADGLAASAEPIYPPELPALLAMLAAGDLPARPLRLGEG